MSEAAYEVYSNEGRHILLEIYAYMSEDYLGLPLLAPPQNWLDQYYGNLTSDNPGYWNEIDVLQEQNVLAIQARAEGRLELCVEHLRTCLEIRKRIFSFDDPEYLYPLKHLIVTCNTFGAEYIRRGKSTLGFRLLKEAEEYVEEAGDLPESTLFLSLVSNNISNYFLRRKKFSAALNYVNKAHANWRKAHMEDKNHIFDVRKGTFLALLDKKEQGMKKLRKTISDLALRSPQVEEEFSVVQFDTDVRKLDLVTNVLVVSHHNLAVDLISLRRYPEAAESCKRAATLCTSLGQNHKWVKDILRTYSVALKLAQMRGTGRMYRIAEPVNTFPELEFDEDYFPLRRNESSNPLAYDMKDRVLLSHEKNIEKPSKARTMLPYIGNVRNLSSVLKQFQGDEDEEPSPRNRQATKRPTGSVGGFAAEKRASPSDKATPKSSSAPPIPMIPTMNGPSEDRVNGGARKFATPGNQPITIQELSQLQSAYSYTTPRVNSSGLDFLEMRARAESMRQSSRGMMHSDMDVESEVEDMRHTRREKLQRMSESPVTRKTKKAVIVETPPESSSPTEINEKAIQFSLKSEENNTDRIGSGTSSFARTVYSSGNEPESNLFVPPIRVGRLQTTSEGFSKSMSAREYREQPRYEQAKKLQPQTARSFVEKEIQNSKPRKKKKPKKKKKKETNVVKERERGEDLEEEAVEVVPITIGSGKKAHVFRNVASRSGLQYTRDNSPRTYVSPIKPDPFAEDVLPPSVLDEGREDEGKKRKTTEGDVQYEREAYEEGMENPTTSTLL